MRSNVQQDGTGNLSTIKREENEDNEEEANESDPQKLDRKDGELGKKPL